MTRVRGARARGPRFWAGVLAAGIAVLCVCAGVAAAEEPGAAAGNKNAAAVVDPAAAAKSTFATGGMPTTKGEGTPESHCPLCEGVVAQMRKEQKPTAVCDTFFRQAPLRADQEEFVADEREAKYRVCHEVSDAIIAHVERTKIEERIYKSTDPPRQICEVLAFCSGPGNGIEPAAKSSPEAASIMAAGEAGVKTVLEPELANKIIDSVKATKSSEVTLAEPPLGKTEDQLIKEKAKEEDEKMAEAKEKALAKGNSAAVADITEAEAEEKARKHANSAVLQTAAGKRDAMRCPVCLQAVALARAKKPLDVVCNTFLPDAKHAEVAKENGAGGQGGGAGGSEAPSSTGEAEAMVRKELCDETIALVDEKKNGAGARQNLMMVMDESKDARVVCHELHACEAPAELPTKNADQVDAEKNARQKAADRKANPQAALNAGSALGVVQPPKQ